MSPAIAVCVCVGCVCVCVWGGGGGGGVNNAHELLNFQHCINNHHIFRFMDKIFCVEF